MLRECIVWQLYFLRDKERFKKMNNIINKPPFPAVPEPVPHLGKAENYFLGSGITGAGGNIQGVWDFLIGPMYSSPNFIESEEIFIGIDGIEYKLNFFMHRGIRSGVFYGTTEIEDIAVCVIDFTNSNEPWAGRLIRVYNKSDSVNHQVSVKARIVPCTTVLAFDVQKDLITFSQKPVNSSHTRVVHNTAIAIKQDTTAVSYGGEDPNWEDRFAFIAFSTTGSTAKAIGEEYWIETASTTIGFGQEYNTGLYHYMHFFEGISDEDYLNKILSRNPEADFKLSIQQWGDWLNEGYPVELSDSRVSHIIESTQILTKMQQCVEGGFIAGVRRYAFSYLRDGHGACRGLLASGHLKEVKQFIEWVDHKFRVFGMIPNSAEMGADLKMLQFLPPENLASEVTAYYLFVMRDYYRKTQDDDLLNKVEKSMKYAMDIQLAYAEEFGWKLMFNGDETERYVPFKDGDVYGGFPALPDWNDDDWSMTSLAACIASLEFYIGLQKRKGSELMQKYEQKLTLLKNSIDEHFWREDLGIHDWCRRKDGSFPEYRVTNLSLLPLWFGASLNHRREASNAVKMADFVNEQGFLPIAPGVSNGFCGHSLGYLLYGLVKLEDDRAGKTFDTLTQSSVIGCWGTVSEFYGPSGVANPHNLRIFESGINLEAILLYLADV
jgi:hypothetical protein